MPHRLKPFHGAEVTGPEDAEAHESIREIRVVELRPVELRCAEVCPAQVRAAEVCAGEVRPGEEGPVQQSAAEVCPVEVRLDEARRPEVRPKKVRCGEVLRRAGPPRRDPSG